METVNILFSMVCRDFHEDVIRELNSKLKMGYKLAITELYRGDTEIFDNTYECGDVYRAYYYKYREYRDCPSIDEDLIKQMQPFDMEVLKMMDRHQSWKWNFEERMQVYFEHIRFWNYILDYYEINYVCFFNTPHEVFDYIIYNLCKIKGIRTSIFMIAPLFPERSILSHDFLREEKNFARFLAGNVCDRNKEEADDEKIYKRRFKEYLSAANERNESKALKLRNWSGSKLKDTITYMSFMDVRNWMEKRYKSRDAQEIQRMYHKLHIRILLKGIQEFSRWVNAAKTFNLWRYYEHFSNIPDKKDKYMYFALHYQPELTSSPMGGGIFSNQLIAIKMLSYCIPDNYKLYVKEHPAQSHVGKQRSFYKRIAAIPNVKIISSRVNQYSLIRNAVATASLTGTVAIESVMSGIPCILFGKELYNSMEGVYMVRKNEECKRAIDDIISGRCCIDRCKIELFFKAVVEYSNNVNVGYGDFNAKENANNMAGLLIRDIQMDTDKGGFYA